MAFEFLRKVSQFIKIEHTVFDLPFIFSGAVIASRGAFLPVTFLLILIAAVSARAAGMSINRIEGRTWDKINPRKKDWVLVNGKLSLKAAILLTVVFSAIFELVSYSLNYLVFLLSPIVLFMFITDPIMKKITPWRHIYMGATIGMGVMGGYLAVTPLLPSTPQIYLIFLSSTRRLNVVNVMILGSLFYSLGYFLVAFIQRRVHLTRMICTQKDRRQQEY